MPLPPILWCWGWVRDAARVYTKDLILFFLDISKVSLILLVTVLTLLLMMMMVLMPMQMQLLLLHAVGENVNHSLHTYFPFPSLPFSQDHCQRRGCLQRKGWTTLKGR